MNPEQQRAILVVVLYAAFAGSAKHDREREGIRRIADSLGTDTGAPNLARLYEDALLLRISLEAAAALTDSRERQLAYEMAVCVCDADAIVDLGEAAVSAVVAGAVTPGPVVVQPNVSEAELNKSILRRRAQRRPGTDAAILGVDGYDSVADQDDLQHRQGLWRRTRPRPHQGIYRHRRGGADLAISRAVRPQAAGPTAGQGSGQDFGKVGNAATGMVLSFATIYALGQLAKRYYAGGWVMSTASLRDIFQNLLGPAKQMQAQYLLQIQQQASTLDAGQIMAMVRGA